MFSNSDVDWFEEIISKYGIEKHNGLVKPAFGRGSIADIPALLKQNLGLSPRHPLPEIMESAREDVDHMVFFLLDGFGHSTVEYSLGSYKMPNMRHFLDRCDYVPVTSVFPSTTSTATVTYQTDLSPIEHGIIGYNAYISELGSVCNMISLTPVGRSDYSLLDHGWKVPAIEASGTIYEEFGRDMVDPHLYLPGAIKGSGMTRITGKGAQVNGYVSVSHMLTALRKNIEKSVRKSFHFCYIPNIDTISHKVGPYTEETAMEIDSLFQLIIDQFIENVRPDGDLGIAISADHGHTVLPSENVADVRDDHRLASMLRAPVAGDFRAPILRVKPEQLDRAVEHLEEFYGNHYLVEKGAEMVNRGYFGYGNREPLHSDRFGDIILVPLDSTGLKDSSLGVLDEKLNRFDLIGMHGGMSREEMIVPLISRTIYSKK